MDKGFKTLNNLRIAYDSYSDDFSFPGDRRRFCFFAKEVNLSFTKYKSSSKYDVVVLSPVSDLNEIKRLKKKGSKIIIEMVDAYLIETPLIKDIIRYLGKQFIFKNYWKMFFPRRYTSQLKRSFEMVDAVICTTEDQKKSVYLTTYLLDLFNNHKLIKIFQKENFEKKRADLYLAQLK